MAARLHTCPAEWPRRKETQGLARENDILAPSLSSPGPWLSSSEPVEGVQRTGVTVCLGMDHRQTNFGPHHDTELPPTPLRPRAKGIGLRQPAPATSFWTTLPQNLNCCEAFV